MRFKVSFFHRYKQNSKMFVQCLSIERWTYYARKKLPDPPIINTAQHSYFRIDCQRPYTLDRFVHGICIVWLMEWHDHWHINNNLRIIITDYLNFTCCQVTKNNKLFYTHFQIFIQILITFE